MYRRGIGLKRNYMLTSQFYRLGCEGGNALGCTNLALMYWYDEIPKDDKRAADLFKLACDANDARGCIGLAYLYENGQGVSKDVERAAELYRQACNQNNTQGCSQLSLSNENKMNAKLTSPELKHSPRR
jgi:uncharacterized protein